MIIRCFGIQVLRHTSCWLTELQGWPEDKVALPGKRGRLSCRFMHREGDPVSSEVLRRAGVATADAVIIAGVGPERGPKEVCAMCSHVPIMLRPAEMDNGQRSKSASRDQKLPAEIKSGPLRPRGPAYTHRLIEVCDAALCA